MRQTLRLLAQVRKGQFLEANAPTGLTGLLTHPSPRPSLIVLYNQTLSKLAQIPEDSVYRQSAEAVTRHRLKIVQDTKPAGYETWLEKVKKEVEKDPAAYEYLKQADGTYAPRFFVGERKIEWDGEKKVKFEEGENTVQDLDRKFKAIQDAEQAALEERKSLDVEPPLDAEQYVFCFFLLHSISSPMSTIYPFSCPHFLNLTYCLLTPTPQKQQNIRHRNQDSRRPNRRNHPSRRRRTQTRR